MKCHKCGGSILQNYYELQCINCGYERVGKMKLYPMLAKTCREPFDDPNYIFERKYDGIRAIAYVEDDCFTLINRSMIDVTSRFPEIDINTTEPCTLDGELICNNFQAMQTRMNRKYNIEQAVVKNPATFIVFDILERDNSLLTGLSLFERKTILRDTIIPTKNCVTADFVVEDGIELFDTATENSWEGIMAKDGHSVYTSGRRSDFWLKIKVRKTIVCDVVGATYGTGKRCSTFGALVLVNNGIYVGEVGTGFTDEEIDNLCSLMHILNKPVRRSDWTFELSRPLKCNISYSEVTSNKQLRFPVFEGVV